SKLNNIKPHQVPFTADAAEQPHCFIPVKSVRLGLSWRRHYRWVKVIYIKCNVYISIQRIQYFINKCVVKAFISHPVRVKRGDTLFLYEIILFLTLCADANLCDLCGKLGDSSCKRCM